MVRGKSDGQAAKHALAGIAPTAVELTAARQVMASYNQKQLHSKTVSFNAFCKRNGDPAAGVNEKRPEMSAYYHVYLARKAKTRGTVQSTTTEYNGTKTKT